MKLPSVQTSKIYFGLGSLLYLQFFLVYGFSNWLTALRTDRYALYFDWETSIPFIPQLIYLYLSLSLFLILPVFYLHETRLKHWAKSYMWMTFIAGILFLLLPSESGVTRPAISTVEPQILFELLYTLDLPYNLFPSLHIAYTSLALLIILSHSEKQTWLALIVSWWLLMVLSVLFLHQHHLADIIGGLLLAIACYHYIYLTGIKIKHER